MDMDHIDRAIGLFKGYIKYQEDGEVLYNFFVFLDAVFCK